MTEAELNKALRRCRKNLFPTMIAWAHGHFNNKEALVVIRLTEGCGFEYSIDLEEWLMGELEHLLAPGQTIEFFWQLMR